LKEAGAEGLPLQRVATGLGVALGNCLWLDWSRSHGNPASVNWWGWCWHENKPTLNLCRKLGFTIAPGPNDATLLRVRKSLAPV
jgi:hypothetical protein